MMKKLVVFLASVVVLVGVLNAKTIKQFVKSCDSFVLVTDESSSMNLYYHWKEKIKLEKKILEIVNKNIPEVDYLSSLESLTCKMNNPDKSVVKNLYPVATYNKTKMAEAISKVKGSDAWTPLSFALKGIESDLKEMNGKIHVIIFSDGEENYEKIKASKVAKDLKQKYNICIYAVQIGDSKEGRKNLKAIVDATGCGKLYSGDSLLNGKDLNKFIKEVFGYEKLVEVKPKPAPRSVVKVEKDSDHDGIYDRYDQCPDTLKGAPVDAHGCWNIPVVYFDTDKYNIKPVFYPMLQSIIHVLKLNPEVKLVIKGYTDSKASEKYNLKLSEKRAKEVAKFFEKNSIASDRLIVKYFGECCPVASNNSEDGRALNRRVEFEILK